MASNETTPLLTPPTAASTSLIRTFSAWRDAAQASPTWRKRASCLVIAAEAFERLAWYSISGTLLVWLTNQPLCLSNTVASGIEIMFTAVMYTAGLLGGLVSDSYISRHKTVVVGYVMYFAGYILLVVVAYQNRWNTQSGSTSTTDEGKACNGTYTINDTYESGDWDKYLYRSLLITALVIIAIAAAIVRTNLAPFGAEQVRIFGRSGSRSFMTWYYWAINLGALVAFAGISFLQERESFALGYLVALAASLSLSFILFLLGLPIYITRTPESKCVVRSIIFKVICNARRVKKNNPDLEVERFLDYAEKARGYPGAVCSQRDIEDTRKMRQILVVVFLMIPYWICYSQMSSSMYLLQGLHMSIDIGGNNTSCNSTPCSHRWDLKDFCPNITERNAVHPYVYEDKQPVITAPLLEISNTIPILLALPFIHWFYQLLTRHNKIVYTYRRLVAGMIMASFSLLAAGTVESARLQNICDCGVKYQQIDYTVYAAAPSVSILYQIFQYCFKAASEIFFIATGLEYFYIKAPYRLQGTSMGLFWFTGGIGYFIGLTLSTAFDVRNEINCRYLDCYFYGLAVFLAIATLIFYKIVTSFRLGLHKVIVIPVPADDRSDVSAEDRSDVSADDRSDVSAEDRSDVSADDRSDVSADDRSGRRRILNSQPADSADENSCCEYS